jgi:type II secretory pathway predicted ATPase ExeA
MYLDHFGLNEAPFKITPATEFFFSGANRGEILQALLYAVTHSEGIIKVSGEVGSGKTMLCRMLLDRLPGNIKTIYLANPSLTRDELLHAIANELGLDLEGQRVNVLLQNLQSHLIEKHRQGERCVVLVDEAHAMPLDTLEELRLLYNLQAGNDKLIQIVLFGQAELNKKLEQSNMRQLKDRIVHHFNIQPISKKVIETYLMFRMRAAGYQGPDMFSHDAIILISKASHGLMRRVNILADKSLLSAFVEDTHKIESRHVQAAIRDSELFPDKPWFTNKSFAMTAGATLAAFALASAGWMLGKEDSTQRAPENTKPAAIATNTQTTIATQAPAIAEANIQAEGKKPLLTGSLLQQRLEATKDMFAHAPKSSVSIQLFYTQDAQPARMEGFLSRAKSIGKLSEIYLIPIKINGKSAFRVLYGIYPNSETARNGMKNLPKRYKDSFAPTLNSLDSY